MYSSENGKVARPFLFDTSEPASLHGRQYNTTPGQAAMPTAIAIYLSISAKRCMSDAHPTPHLVVPEPLLDLLQLTGQLPVV